MEVFYNVAIGTCNKVTMLFCVFKFFFFLLKFTAVILHLYSHNVLQQSCSRSLGPETFEKGLAIIQTEVNAWRNQSIIAPRHNP